MCLCLFKHIKVYRHKWTYTNTYLFYHSYLMNDIEWRKKKNLLPYIITKNAYIAWSIWSILIVYITRALLQRAYRRIYDFEWAHKNKRLWTCIYIYDRWSNTDEWIGYNYIYMMIVKDTYIHTHTDIKAHSLIFKKAYDRGGVAIFLSSLLDKCENHIQRAEVAWQELTSKKYEPNDH